MGTYASPSQSQYSGNLASMSFHAASALESYPMSHPPAIPSGAHPFVAMSADEPPRWTIRYAMEGEDETTDRPRVMGTPTFTRLVVADQYRAWVAGEVPSFSYPSGIA